MKKSPILKQIEWQDLRHLTAWQVAYNVILPYPFLALSWYFASQNQFIIAMIFSFFCFMSALKQSHDAYHQTLGVNRLANELLLFILSFTMLCSTHAIRHTHLEHHRDMLGTDDVEGNWSKLPWYQSILFGGAFAYKIHHSGLTQGRKQNRLFSLLDMMIIAGVWLLAWVTGWQIIVYHVLVMFVANWLVGFFAVWSVHHGCEDEIGSRTERNGVINWLTFNLLYHAEHHAFPAVPSNHLPILAKRLDEKLPIVTSKKVLPFLQTRSNNETCPIRRRFA